jgi:hypothetical protein
MLDPLVSPRTRQSLLVLFLLFFSGCVPFVADQQSARLLDDGQLEVTPSFSSASFANQGEMEHVQDQLGLRLAYGVSTTVEVRAMYERVILDDDVTSQDDVNLFGAGAKFAVVPDQLALFVPVGFAFGGDLDSGDSFTFYPTLLASLRAAEGLELNPSVKAIYPFAAEDQTLFLGFHLGAAIGPDLDRWAVRPELGAVINTREAGVTWGWTLGFSYRPPGR